VQMRRFAIEHKDLQEQIAELRQYFIQYTKDNDMEINKINEATFCLTEQNPHKSDLRRSNSLIC